jgi:hypothetical protein
MKRYHKRKARGELRSELWYPLSGLGLGAIVLAIVGVQNFWSLFAVACLLGSAVLAIVAVALYQGKSWVRWPGAFVFGALCVSGVLALVREGFDGGILWKTVLTGIFALYLAEPSTAELFRVAEEDIEEDQDSAATQE